MARVGAFRSTRTQPTQCPWRPRADVLLSNRDRNRDRDRDRDRHRVGEAAPTFKRGFGHHTLWVFVDHGPDGTGEPLWCSCARAAPAGAPPRTTSPSSAMRCASSYPGTAAVSDPALGSSCGPPLQAALGDSSTARRAPVSCSLTVVAGTGVGVCA